LVGNIGHIINVDVTVFTKFSDGDVTATSQATKGSVYIDMHRSRDREHSVFIKIVLFCSTRTTRYK